MQMASRLVSTLLLRPIVAVKVSRSLSNASVVAGSKFYSTQPHLGINVNKSTADVPVSPWKLYAAVCLVSMTWLTATGTKPVKKHVVLWEFFKHINTCNEIRFCIFAQ